MKIYSIKRVLRAAAYTSAALAATVVATSCKPTVDAYRQAYMAALKSDKEQEVDPDIPQMSSLASFDGPRIYHLANGDSVAYRYLSLRRMEGDTARLHPYNVVVAVYGISTNARAHAERLAAKGYDATVLCDGANHYHTVAAQFDSIAPAPVFMRKYMTDNKNDMYVSLPGKPVVEIPTSLGVMIH